MKIENAGSHTCCIKVDGVSISLKIGEHLTHICEVDPPIAYVLGQLQGQWTRRLDVLREAACENHKKADMLLFAQNAAAAKELEKCSADLHQVIDTSIYNRDNIPNTNQEK